MRCTTGQLTNWNTTCPHRGPDCIAERGIYADFCRLLHQQALGRVVQQPSLKYSSVPLGTAELRVTTAQGESVVIRDLELGA